MDSNAHARQFFLVCVAIAVLAGVHRTSLPVSDTSLDVAFGQPETVSGPALLRSAVPVAPGGAGVSRPSPSSRHSGPGSVSTDVASQGDAQQDGWLRVAAPDFVHDHLMTEASTRLIDSRGRLLVWVRGDADEAARALASGRVHAAVIVGRSRSRSASSDQRVLLGDFVAVAVVHPDNPVNSLAKAQLRAILSGFTSDWNRFGGRSLPIRVHSLSASVDSFGLLVASCLGLAATNPHEIKHETLAHMAGRVRRERAGFALLPVELAEQSQLKMLKIDGLGAPRDKTGSLAYPLTVPVVLAVRDDAAYAHDLAQRLQATLQHIIVNTSWRARTQPRLPVRGPKPQLIGRKRAW